MGNNAEVAYVFHPVFGRGVSGCKDTTKKSFGGVFVEKYCHMSALELRPGRFWSVVEAAARPLFKVINRWLMISFLTNGLGIAEKTVILPPINHK
ncbi:MAG: hypothetical protein K5650_06835 [Bacteroidales bacterium]|nr:hypothetical protein [Bacteroidales bacterium]